MKPIVAYAPTIDTGMIGSESQLSNHARNYPVVENSQTTEDSREMNLSRLAKL